MLKVIIFFLIFSSIQARQLCNGIAPENDLWIGVHDRNTSEITKEQFDEILDNISDLYKPIFLSLGKKLIVKRNWQDGTVNAYASQTGDNWYIHMFGGFARHEETTYDGFALVACHEIGHHIGGAPKAGADSWITNEGQSDYFGTTKCFRRLVELDDNLAIVSKMDIPDFVTNKCQSIYSNANEVAICQRSSMAGLSLGKVLATTDFGKKEVSFDSPSKKKVWWTIHHHPRAQCRLDTYFQGALCDKDHKSDFSDQDANLNACTRSEGYRVGVRPRCWYKP